MRRPLSLLLVAAFIGVAHGQAYGVRHCPYHDALPGSHSGDRPTASSVAAGASDRARDGATSTGPRHSEPAGPCTCLGDCHTGPATVGPASGPALLTALPGPPLLSTAGTPAEMLRGPRHDLFELHRPNAPPLLPS